MAIYDITGNSLDSVYGTGGELLGQAYDIDGNELIEPVQTELVVMSYNVQGFTGLNANESMQSGIISTYNPLIVGLQELGRNTSFPSVGAAVFSDYPYKYLSPPIYNRPAIASKVQLNDVTGNEFVNQDGESKGYQKSYFSFSGKTICWINAHLATSDNESAKVAQAHELYELVQNETYFIITGDFNTVCKTTSATEYTTIMKQFIDAGYHSANCSEQHGFIDTWTSGHTSGGTWYPCDHIITSANISINTVIADMTKIAIAEQTSQSIDHLPIIAYLTIN